MRKTENTDARSYHHGGLSRALVGAAQRILEAEGPSALSLRAVTRHAGVTPSAFYHHFKDKTDLLEAVSHGGWEDVPRIIGVAHVRFARENPAPYRLMYDTTRGRTSMPEHTGQDGSGHAQVGSALTAVGCNPDDVDELELQTIACWCAAHGLAKIAGFKGCQPRKEAMGADSFARAILRTLGLFNPPQTPRAGGPRCAVPN